MAILNITNKTLCSSNSDVTYLDNFLYVWIFTGGLSICVNVIVVLATKKCSHLNRPTHKLLVNLALADGTSAIHQTFLLPISAWSDTSYGFCVGIYYLVTVAESNSLLTLLLISLDRFIAICRPLHYYRLVTQQRIMGAVCASWVASLLVGCPILIDHNQLAKKCIYEIVIGRKALLVDFIFIITCVVILLVNYIYLLTIARKHLRKITMERLVEYRINFRAGYFKEQLRLLTTFGIIIGSFLGCWTAACVLLLLGYAGVCTHTGGVLWGISYTLVFTHAFMNFFVYTWRMKEYRKAIRSMLCRKKCDGRLVQTKTELTVISVGPN